MSKKQQITLAAFALSLGQSDRMSHTTSEPLHKSYKAADADGQSAQRAEFYTNFIAGRLSVTKVIAAKIADKGRTNKNKGQADAYGAAKNKFTYHIARTSTVAGAGDELKGVFAAVVKDLTSLRRLSRKLTVADARELRGEISKLLETYAIEE